MAVRAHEQACTLPEGEAPEALPAASRPPGRARVSLLSQARQKQHITDVTLLS